MVSKFILAVGRYHAGSWRIKTGDGMYVIQVDRGQGWETAIKAKDWYTAHSAYNQMTEQPRQLLFIGKDGGQVIRTSDEDGHAAGFAARNQVQEAAQ